MVQSGTDIVIRNARDTDLPFINSLSPTLAGVAKLDWQSDDAIQKFQDAYIAEMMAETDLKAITLIAEKSGAPVGFIHAREGLDEISGEECGTVPLLAVKEGFQGCGVGKLLIHAAEKWSKEHGYRLLHLEVFASNTSGRDFYHRLGFKPETINMMKALD